MMAGQAGMVLWGILTRAGEGRAVPLADMVKMVKRQVRGIGYRAIAKIVEKLRVNYALELVSGAGYRINDEWVATLSQWQTAWEVFIEGKQVKA